MQICPPNEEKWVLCASKEEDYLRWCSVLEKFVKEKVVFVPGSNGMSPLNYASDDEGYRSSHSVMSGTSTPDPFVRSKSGSDPKNPNQTILSKLTRRGIDFAFEINAKCRLQSATLFIQRSICCNMMLYFVVKKLKRGNICNVVFMFDPTTNDTWITFLMLYSDIILLHKYQQLSP
jgi:hypothetical protein